MQSDAFYDTRIAEIRNLMRAGGSRDEVRARAVTLMLGVTRQLLNAEERLRRGGMSLEAKELQRLVDTTRRCKRVQDKLNVILRSAFLRVNPPTKL